MIIPSARISGLKRVITNMRRQDERFARGVSRGLKKGGLFIQRESQLMVPVDTGNLKASAFTRAFGTGFQTVVVVGYEASYALFVHENIEMKWKGRLRPRTKVTRGSKTRGPGYRGHYWDPQNLRQAGAKFLENPVREKKDEVVKIVRDEAFKAAALFHSRIL